MKYSKLDEASLEIEHKIHRLVQSNSSDLRKVPKYSIEDHDHAKIRDIVIGYEICEHPRCLVLHIRFDSQSK